MFTNVLSPLHWNFSSDTVPSALQDAPRFVLNNPIALQRKYLNLKDDPNMENRRRDLRSAAEASEQNSLQMLVMLFDWLAGLEPQQVPAKDQAVAKEASHSSVSKATCLHLAWRSNLILIWNRL